MSTRIAKSKTAAALVNTENNKGPADNLAPKWKPGQSGNPAGRPKGSISLMAAIIRVLKQTDPETGKKRLDDLALTVVENAKAGNAQAIRQIFDRLDGPVQTMADIDDSNDHGGLWAAMHLTPDEMKELWGDSEPNEITEVIEEYEQSSQG